MLIYKFKTRFEEQDDFLREIELRADQTFEDFHQAILGNLGLDPGMLASFFICDHRFRKKTEIQLIDMDPIAPPGEDDLVEEPSESTKKSLLMHECILKDYIDDPHQRLLFVYDNLNQWTFYIELIKITPAKPDQGYPHFSKVVGPVPRELAATPKQIPGVETSMDFAFDDGQPSLEDLSHFDQIEGEDDFFDENGPSEPDEFDEER